jgi:hypothetical protein
MPGETLTDPAERFWANVDALLAGADTAGALANRVGPLAAKARRRRGLPVPEALALEERLAAIAVLAAPKLLEHVRAGCDGPLVLMKGPEVATLYPESARSFADVDLLVLDARLVHQQLQDAGFEKTGDPVLFHRLHHLRPLRWPTLPLVVEIHSTPKWPERLAPPDPAEIIDRAIPSALGVAGVQAPDPARHAVLIAAHAWAHQPLRNLRDVIDTCAVATGADPDELASVAATWGVSKLWRVTVQTGASVLGGRRKVAATRIWARHLGRVRERTVLENHLGELLAGYWALPPRAAFDASRAALVADLKPAFDEGWREKLVRTARALQNAAVPLSDHDRSLGDAAFRGQGRNPPDDSTT